MNEHYYYNFPKAIIIKVAFVILGFLALLFILKVETPLILIITGSLLFVFFILKSLFIFYFADKAISDRLCPKCFKRSLEGGISNSELKCSACNTVFNIFIDKGNVRRIIVGISLAAFVLFGLASKEINDEKIKKMNDAQSNLKHMRQDFSYW